METYPAIRSIHLQGGCRASDADGKLMLDPPASNGRVASFPIPQYVAAYAMLAKGGFRIVGVDFHTNVEQTDGRRLPDWRAYHHIGSTSWPCAEQADRWSFIAHSAILAKNGLLWDVASRIRHQLRTCDWRLRQISDSYHNQLQAIVRAGTFRNALRFSDGFTWLGYLALQSFLVDACVLRDYLAEYRALVLSQADQHTFKSKITRLGPLKKHYLDKVTPSEPVDHELVRASSLGGWLRLLGDYRDLVVHFAPLESAGKTLFAVCNQLPLNAETTLPCIKLPIPSDPEAIYKSRTSGAYWEDPEQNYARFVNALEDPESALDGLQYAHSSLGHLSVLAGMLADISPVKPQIPKLTEKDILNIQINDHSDPKRDPTP